MRYPCKCFINFSMYFNMQEKASLDSPQQKIIKSLGVYLTLPKDLKVDVFKIGHRDFLCPVSLAIKEDCRLLTAQFYHLSRLSHRNG